MTTRLKTRPESAWSNMTSLGRSGRGGVASALLAVGLLVGCGDSGGKDDIGGKIAMLGIPSEEIAIDWNKVVFNMLTIKGIYGREMYETWYQMSVMLESGLNIKPVITHRFHYTEFQKGLEAMISGLSGKVVLDWN